MRTDSIKQAEVSPTAAALAADVGATAAARGTLRLRKKSEQPIALHQAMFRFSPDVSLASVLGALALGACIAPWLARGWLVFDLISVLALLLACYDAFSLWIVRDEDVPILRLPEKGLGGREGQTIDIPLALKGSGKRRSRKVRAGIMATTAESEGAFRVQKEAQWINLEESNPPEAGATPANGAQLHLWPWAPELTLLHRGVWPAPRVGLERQSGFRLWRLRQWFDIPEPLRIEVDLRSGQQEILRSPVYRLLVASQQTPWTGHGREFERLREYQPGDTYSEIAWKSTARRANPVTRLFQWEQKQEVYFVIDQSRASALALDPRGESENVATQKRGPRRLLDLAVETALVGATVALELGDDFGLVTYADEPKSWLRAGSGRSHFHRFRERLRDIEPLPTTADYEVLFREIRVRLRRRAYLLMLADLTERSVSDSLRRGIGLIRSGHALLITSILPTHAPPAFSPDENLHADQDVYTALAGEKENQRLGALARQMRQLDVQLRYVSAEAFLRTAVEGYLQSKREQRL
jgi:uncharacterized protein (DUF58 family)